jgi:hypothetical protein
MHPVLFGNRASRYASQVPLVACPFCREMFEEGEATTCPVCGVALTAFEKLPASLDAIHEDGAIPEAPEFEKLPAKYIGRNKGVIAALAIVGIALFFLPWIDMTLPYVRSLSGFDLARRAGWSWGAGVAWTVLVPTVLSRRSIVQMRGARVAAFFLSAIPAFTIAILVLFPPHSSIIPVRFAYAWPMWVSVAVSLLAAAASTRLGGRIDDIRVARGTSRGEAVH